MTITVCLRLSAAETPKPFAAESIPITAFSLGYRARLQAKRSYQEGPSG